MSNVSSPNRFSGLEDRFYSNIDINEKMRVPKIIKVSGDNSEVAVRPNPWDAEKFDMKVPDRILVVGQDQYYGTTAPPREVVLENTVMPPDPGMIRVQTPPRVITLSEHYFPTVEDDDEMLDSESGAASDKSPSNALISQSKIIPDNPWNSISAINGSGENSNKSLLPVEELSHLRTQMAKLNRRLMALEMDNLQRQQREKYLVALGLGYFLVKFVIWLNK
ncbi:hypothetical protein RUM44_003904 [Polyplax serrata]|uniref:Mff-like domain-containing protein n=1 Tax=Polyplax serrata TaxID=468196 RepID=A0ABR1B2W8_POLSC